MTTLFSSIQLGNVQIKNRFVRSATYEAMASENGSVTDQLVKMYQVLAKGNIGLIIPGYTYVHPYGKAFPFQIGIHNEEMIPGLKRLVDGVHQEGGKILLQLAHAGRQTIKKLIGRQPIGPSSFDRDPMNMVKPAAMTEEEIQEAIGAFGEAAKRAALAGADGIQLHAAHGYLINQFISPFFNKRTDNWGGTEENRFRFLKEVIIASRNNIPEGMPILIKLSTNDFTPKEGVTPTLAVKYAEWLAKLPINGIELSSGSAIYSFMNMSRGEVPVDDFVSGLPWWKKPLGRMMMKSLVGKFDLEEGYNIQAAKLIKPVINGIPLSIVGGFRRRVHMEEVIDKGFTDMISMSRPFIREPNIVKKFSEGKTDRVACISCNKCLAGVANGLKVRCYSKK